MFDDTTSVVLLSVTPNMPSRSTSLPRSVLRNDDGASDISFSR